MKHLFALLFKTDNRIVYSGYHRLILGIYTEEGFYYIYELNVNNQINVRTYYNLLKDNDFEKSDFKPIEKEKLENILTEHKSGIIKCIFSDNSIPLKKFLEDLLKNNK